MKPKFWLILSALSLLILSIAVWAASWTYLNLDGGPISSVSTAGSIIYAVSQKYIYKSINKGESFQKLTTFSDVGKVVVDKTNPNIVYALRTTSIYKSVNGGTNWPRFFNSGARDLVISPQLGTFLLSATTEKFIAQPIAAVIGPRGVYNYSEDINPRTTQISF